MPKKALIMYVPNLHRGYGQLVNEVHPKVIYLLDESVIAMMIHKDPTENKDRKYLSRSFLHGWDAWLIKKFMDSIWLERGFDTKILRQGDVWATLKAIKAEGLDVVMPEEDVSRYFYEDNMKPQEMIPEFSDKIFLRYNKLNAEKGEQPVSDAKIVLDLNVNAPRDIIKLLAMEAAQSQATKSSDWWRQVGAVVFDEESKEIKLEGFNKHLPDGHYLYMFGDARSSFNAGHRPELVTAIHAEQMIFAEATRRGLSLEGLSMYVSTYPCPYCANQIALSGIKKLYFTDGYSVMDQGRKLFEAFGIETIWLTEEVMTKAAT